MCARITDNIGLTASALTCPAIALAVPARGGTYRWHIILRVPAAVETRMTAAPRASRRWAGRACQTRPAASAKPGTEYLSGRTMLSPPSRPASPGLIPSEGCQMARQSHSNPEGRADNSLIKIVCTQPYTTAGQLAGRTHRTFRISYLPVRVVCRGKNWIAHLFGDGYAQR